MNKQIKKILIANRSEIAKRIIFACQSLGIKTVAIFSKEDEFSPYVYLADEAYKLIGKGGPAYLNSSEIIEIAKKSGACAIHPGYGFLSENSHFAKMVSESGLIFIGPDWQIIQAMGSKTNARAIAKELGIPLAHGKEFCNVHNFEEINKAVSEIGFPVIIKAALGGGGKAMKKVSEIENLEQAYVSVCRESKTLFNNDNIVVEKFLPMARHVEVQIVGDGKNVIHLYERECTIQRRNQKIIEETPTNFVPKIVLEKLYNYSTSLARKLKYNSVGTVEFLISDEEIYFCEMNTRLQVEHTVTEMTCGIDLVATQIKIASGESVLTQEEITQKGHAIQARIYAEDPYNNFIPSVGKIELLNLPEGPFLRHEHDLEEGKLITQYFDPMLSKLIAWGQNREQARMTLLNGLNNLAICGINTNIDFLKQLLKSNEFISGNFSTENLFTTKQSSNENFAIAQALKKHAIKKQESLAKINNWKEQQWQ